MLDGYIDLPREVWSRAPRSHPPLGEATLAAIQGVNAPVDAAEVDTVFSPLARVIEVQRDAKLARTQRTAELLDTPIPRPPFLLGIAGSVAVGKSTLSRLLQVLLANGPGRPKVDLVTTDGFLLPNATLLERGIMERKGFPESYDLRALMRFVRDVRRGAPATSPVYSHVTYDIDPERQVVVDAPDIVILEGLNVLQTGRANRRSRALLSDYLDFSLYLDADTDDIARWFEERFAVLRRTAFTDPRSHFKAYAAMSDEDAMAFCRRVWREINLVNLEENILATRARADAIVEKGPDHRVRRVRLRRV